MFNYISGYHSKLLIVQALAIGILSAFIIPKVLMDITIFIQGKPEQQIEQQLRAFGSKSLEKGIIAAITEAKNESYTKVARYFQTYILVALSLAFIIAFCAYISKCSIFRSLAMVLLGQLLIIIMQTLNVAGLENYLVVIQIIALILAMISAFLYAYYRNRIMPDNSLC